jgi:hypothetical protein
MLCAHLAQAFLPMTVALVRWNTFDEDAWLREANAVKTMVPEQFREGWEAQFKPWVFI